MNIKNDIQFVLEAEEQRTVNDSFGGARIGVGRSPAFDLSTVLQALKNSMKLYPLEPIAIHYVSLVSVTNESVADKIALSAMRFAFMVELTNLKITSTKMKTRWLPGLITKVAQGSYTNFQGDFSPGNDPRSSTFNDCHDIFENVLSVLASGINEATRALKVLIDLYTIRSTSRVPYEFVFTYIDQLATPIHTLTNIRMVNLTTLEWLVKARPIFSNALPAHTLEKITTKTYKTDRAQTGVDQTNRAKRWEVLSGDFQQASIEECWSVEKVLLETLPGFTLFPQATHAALVAQGLIVTTAPKVCPITLEPLDFPGFIAPSAHGQSGYQVGHLIPLKTGGRHTGSNISWITDNGNRIQGDFDIATIRSMLKQISNRMIAMGI